MPVIIRKYRSADLPQLTSLITALQDHIAHLDEYKRHRPAPDFDGKKYMKLLFKKIKSQNGVIFVAEEKKDVVGCAIGTMSEKHAEDIVEEYPDREGKINELIVRTDQRGKKIGVALVKAMEDFFREQKCDFVRVGVFAPNVGAYEFYKKLDYMDRYVDLLKNLKI